MNITLKQSILFLATSFLFCHYGCEEVINNTNLPYEEKLVIRGIVLDGDSIDSLYVGRTLPYEEFRFGYWNSKDSIYVENDLSSFVKDAVVTISVDDQTYPLHYFKSGYYKNDSLVGATGKTYRLHIEWKGKIADAVTTIPETPIVDSVNVAYKTTAVYTHGSEVEYSCSAYIHGKVNNIFSFELSHKHIDSNPFDTSYHYTYEYSTGSAVKKRTQTDYNVPDIFTRKIVEYVNVGYIDPQLIFTIKSYDEPYYKYFLSYKNLNSKDDFSIEPNPIDWNVSGNAIGMFIGASKSVTKTYKLQ
jgi:hypothetical protein